MKGRRGQAVLEFAFVLPFLLFLFVGAFDWGFYSQALITTENAARVAALYTSSSSSTVTDYATACNYVLGEFAAAPNISGISDCSNSTLTVTATAVSGPDGSPAAKVSVAYQTSKLIPIPTAMAGQFTITRVVIMKVRT
jgi:Flp pilus assembly protein TadG